MFQMRSERFARVSGSQQIGFETLEGRQLLSAAPSASVTKAELLAPGHAIKAAVLGPSAVEGRYKGLITESDGTTIEAKIVVTATRAELIIAGATLKETLTSIHLVQIRKGTFDVKFSSGSTFVSVVGTENSTGTKISGTYRTSTSKSGTFAVKKYANS